MSTVIFDKPNNHFIMSKFKTILNKAKYVVTKTFVKHILIAMLLVIILVKGAFFVLEKYTRHNEWLEVPNLKGIMLSEVKNILEEKGLRCVVTDSIFSQELPKGAVVDQNPPAKFKVKKERKIFLTTNAVNPEMVKMPDVTNRSFRQAKADLNSVGLLIGYLNYIENQPRNFVLKQKLNGNSVKQGDLIEKGTKVQLTLGLGNTEETDLPETYIPRLKGFTQREVLSKLINTYLNVGEIHYDNSVVSNIDKINAKVFKQEPSPNYNNPLLYGTPVNIWLSIDEEKTKKK